MDWGQGALVATAAAGRALTLALMHPFPLQVSCIRFSADSLSWPADSGQKRPSGVYGTSCASDPSPVKLQTQEGYHADCALLSGA